MIFLSFSDSFISSQHTDFTQFEKEIDSFCDGQQKNKLLTDHRIDSAFANDTPADKNDQKIKLFNFDPNHLPDETWKKLGLSDKQIRIIKKYESKGGKFYKSEDLKKIYSISEKQYLSLAPYINIPGKKPQFVNRISEKKAELIIEINTADSLELIKLKGIGPAFVKRIINYRNLLGGFINKNQLLEVYGFDKEKLGLIVAQITLDSSKIMKININTCSLNELKKHPYIKFNIANAIVNYRKKHGNYLNLYDIKNSDIINQEVYLKILPYLILAN